MKHHVRSRYSRKPTSPKIEPNASFCLPDFKAIEDCRSTLERHFGKAGIFTMKADICLSYTFLMTIKCF
jgi:hypothetical protein